MRALADLAALAAPASLREAIATRIAQAAARDDELLTALLECLVALVTARNVPATRMIADLPVAIGAIHAAVLAACADADLLDVLAATGGAVMWSIQALPPRDRDPALAGTLIALQQSLGKLG